MKSETVLEIQFSGPVSGAGKLAAYRLAKVTTRKVKKSVQTILTPIKLASALPASSPTTSSVAIVLASTPNLAQTDELQIIAADLTDSQGRALDGNRDGLPGGNAIVLIGPKSVSFSALSPRPQAAVNQKRGTTRLH